jgi:hypothetical protein
VTQTSESAPPGALALSPSEIQLLAALSEAIIPTTDTPGAAAAGVPEFLALLYTDRMLPEEQAQFRSGLRELDESAQARHEKSFAALSAGQQLQLIEIWDAECSAARQANRPLPYFARLRALVIVGYYTSKVGQESELKVQFGGGADQSGGPIFGAVPIHF